MLKRPLASAKVALPEEPTETSASSGRSSSLALQLVLRHDATPEPVTECLLHESCVLNKLTLHFMEHKYRKTNGPIFSKAEKNHSDMPFAN